MIYADTNFITRMYLEQYASDVADGLIASVLSGVVQPLPMTGCDRPMMYAGRPAPEARLNGTDNDSTIPKGSEPLAGG